MRRDLRPFALGMALLGVAVGELFSYPAGVAVSFVGVFLSFGSIPRLNTFATRTIALVVIGLHGFVISRGSGNALLGVAPSIAIICVLPTETMNRRFAYQIGWIAPLSPVGEIIVGALARPWTVWHLALLPTILGATAFAISLTKGMVDFNRRGRAVTYKIGAEFPDFTLPARLGMPEFTLSAHRGQHVLVCLLRGDWCPVCHVMMRIISKDAPILAKHGVKVVGISAAEGVAADDFARAIGVDYTLLVDPKCTVAQALGAVHPDEPDPGKSTNLPAMFLVDPEGRIAYGSTAHELTLHNPRAVIHLLSAKA